MGRLGKRLGQTFHIDLLGPGGGKILGLLTPMILYYSELDSFSLLPAILLK